MLKVAARDDGRVRRCPLDPFLSRNPIAALAVLEHFFFFFFFFTFWNNATCKFEVILICVLLAVCVSLFFFFCGCIEINGMRNYVVLYMRYCKFLRDGSF